MEIKNIDYSYNNSDLIMIAAKTLQLLPFRPGFFAAALMFCFVSSPEGRAQSPAETPAVSRPTEPRAIPRPVITPPAPQTEEPVAPKTETAPEMKEQPVSQFAKNVSPSGVALGVLDREISKEGIPESLEELAQAGAMASTERNWSKAREAFYKMTEKAPKNALAYANLGVAEYQLGSYEAARTALRRSLNLNPAIAQNWLTMGLIYHKEENLPLAIAALARALHQDPSDPRTHLYMAVVIHDYGWGGAAEVELQRAIELDPKYADAHFNLALMYLERDPPAIELARRHYYAATDLGAAPDPEIEKQLRIGMTPAPVVP